MSPETIILILALALIFLAADSIQQRSRIRSHKMASLTRIRNLILDGDRIFKNLKEINTSNKNLRDQLSALHAENEKLIAVNDNLINVVYSRPYDEGSISNFVFRQRTFSNKAFGPGARTEGILKHIESELSEIRENPHDLIEWIDVIILAIDGAWRAGYTPEEIQCGLYGKQDINCQRQWPAATPEDEPAFHVKPVDVVKI